MKNPYQGLSSGDRRIVALIATAIANGNLLPHNRHSPLAARRVFEALKDACIMHCEEDRLNGGRTLMSAFHPKQTSA